ncbi:MAG: thioredoxin domain-containing protein, partial [Halothiobacillaceae bacterium]
MRSQRPRRRICAMTATPRCRTRTARTEASQRTRRLAPWLAFVLCLHALAASAEPLRNALTGTTSPYLAMHADDPVAWQTWSSDTLERARSEGRLILISSGFFA